MKKTIWLRIAESCAFVILLAAVLVYTSGVVKRKKGYVLFGTFLEEPEIFFS